MNNDEFFDELCKQVREAYILERRFYEERVSRKSSNFGSFKVPHLDGGTDSFGRRHKSVWPKITKFMLDNGLSPRDYFRSVFDLWCGSSAPNINAFMSDKALAIGKKYQRIAREQLLHSFYAQKRRAKQEILVTRNYQPIWSDTDVYRYVITNSTLNLSALFRYCLAINTKQDDLAEIYLIPAIIQYISHPEEYNEIIKNIIPVNFKSIVDSCISRALR